MGSDSDWPVMSAAAQVLTDFDVPHEVSVVSAHRTPARMVDYARTAADRGLRVIIAGAGGAAHLPGMVASCTVLPVIGVPVPLSRLDGLDSLLSIVQMPAGIPVATVSIGGAANAGLLAVRILAAGGDARLTGRLAEYAAGLEALVLEKDAALQATLDRLMARLFAALLLPVEASAHLDEHLDGLRSARPDLRWQPPAKWHLTLEFLGECGPREVDRQLERWERRARRGQPFDLHLAGAGTFGKTFAARVLWAGLDGDLEGWRRIAAFDQQPHVTLARTGNAST